MHLPILDIDLDRPPGERWGPLAAHVPAIRVLVANYTRELGGLELARDVLVAYRDENVPDDYLAEIDAVAAIADLDPLEVLLANVYYDAFKHAMGCTAFARDTESGPIHARNLDWWSEGDVLGRTSVHLRFFEGGRIAFEGVGWPGFIGLLSGVARGRFAVTLNAALSDDAAGVGRPIAFLLRDLLASARYEEAVHALASEPIACDALFLVTGVAAGQMCVVERTPSRAAIRRAEDGLVVLTNDFRELRVDLPAASGSNDLLASACGRFERAMERAIHERPVDVGGCFAILGDPRVRMDMTIQRMVFQPSTGTIVAERA